MTRHNVNIVSRRDGTRFEVDGYDIAPGLRSATIELAHDGTANITVKVPASVIDVVRLTSPGAEVVLSLPPGARDALIALGWTPPTGDAE